MATIDKPKQSDSCDRILVVAPNLSPPSFAEVTTIERLWESPFVERVNDGDRFREIAEIGGAP